jgi:hypothetical protein
MTYFFCGMPCDGFNILGMLHHHRYTLKIAIGLDYKEVEFELVVWFR